VAALVQTARTGILFPAEYLSSPAVLDSVNHNT